MNTTLLVAGIAGALLVLALIIALAAANRRGKSDGLPVESKPLMSDRERRVLGMIEAAAPGCRIHAQVAMAALITCRKDVPKDKRTAVRNRFDRKFVDYVVEHRASGDVLAIIELDDRTHNSAKDKARDEITEAAGYRTIRLPAGERINSQLVAERVAPLLGQTQPA